MDARCTAEAIDFNTGWTRHPEWKRCKVFVPDWDGNEDPLCEEHSAENQAMEAADLAVKASKEDEL